MMLHVRPEVLNLITKAVVAGSKDQTSDFSPTSHVPTNFQKIPFVRVLRAETGVGLREGKLVADELVDNGVDIISAARTFQNIMARDNLRIRVKELPGRRTFRDILFEVLDVCREHTSVGLVKQIVVMLWGDRGSGKTWMYREYSELRKLMYTLVNWGQFDTPGDALGMPYLEDTKGKSGNSYKHTRAGAPEWFPTGDVPTFLHCDELNRANNLVRQLHHGFLLDRMVGTHPLPDNCFVACTANPPEGEYGVQDLDIAVMDRLLHISLPDDPSASGWLQWSIGQNVDSRIISMVAENPSLVAHKVFANPRTGPSKRSWHMLSILLSKNNISREAMLLIAHGLLGVDVGSMFLEQWDAMDSSSRPISPMDVLNNYEAVRERVKIMASWRFRRLDILNLTVVQLNNILKAAGKLSELQVENINRFKSDLPEEVCASIIF